MTRRKLLGKTGLTVSALLVVLVCGAPAASAVAPPSRPSGSDTAAMCRSDEASGLLELFGLTRGECVASLTQGDGLHANARYAGLCGSELFRAGDANKGQCVKAADATRRAFHATLSESINQYGPVTGSGTATRMSAVAETGTVYGYGFGDFPAAFGLLISGAISDGHGDAVFVNYVLTLTDTANPPAGEHYRATGAFSISSGTGRFVDAGGGGEITGTCTSSFDSPIAHCDNTWTGGIDF